MKKTRFMMKNSCIRENPFRTKNILMYLQMLYSAYLNK